RPATRSAATSGSNAYRFLRTMLNPLLLDRDRSRAERIGGARVLVLGVTPFSPVQRNGTAAEHFALAGKWLTSTVGNHLDVVELPPVFGVAGTTSDQANSA